jgi:hypothetical protein
MSWEQNRGGVFPEVDHRYLGCEVSDTGKICGLS